MCWQRSPLLRRLGEEIGRLVLPEINKNSLGLISVQYQLVCLTQERQMAHLIYVGPLIVVLDDAHDHGVVCKVHGVIDGEPCAAVICHHGGEELLSTRTAWGLPMNV